MCFKLYHILVHKAIRDKLGTITSSQFWVQYLYEVLLWFVLTATDSQDISNRSELSKNRPLRSFNRVFMIVPFGEGFCIVNELLFVTNAKDEHRGCVTIS
jgi:hypothetical protein